MPYGTRSFQIDFDFIDHVLRIEECYGEEVQLALRPMPVAEFYAKVMELLRSLDINVSIRTTPNEVPNAIPFDQDYEHQSYDATYAHRFWRVLLQVDRLFKIFRSRFIGKVSPVHVFWGAPDLAVTRFSGRRAPLHPGGVPNMPDWAVREAYSHEVSSAGFWPGNDMFPRAAFYSYAYPEPPGFKTFTVPDGAYYEGTLGEFILPYDTVRQASDPDGLLLDFLMSTYTAAAEAAHWDRAALECDFGIPGRVRSI
jgi:hypothetical protein